MLIVVKCDFCEKVGGYKDADVEGLAARAIDSLLKIRAAVAKSDAGS